MARHKAKKSGKTTDHTDSANHGDAADIAKYNLRNEKDLNKAHPLSEKNSTPEHLEKGN